MYKRLSQKPKTAEVYSIIYLKHIYINYIMRFFSTQIPRAVREQLWLKTFGEKFSAKCEIKWCKNRVNVFDFTAGHNLPKSKGGSNKLNNLHVICSRCNLSMGNRYTIDEWNKQF